MSTSSSSSSSRQSLDPANTSTDLDFSFVSHGRPSIAPEMEEEHDLPTLDELTARKSALMRSDIVFDANDWLSLIDKYLVLGEVDASDEVIEPAVELCKCTSLPLSYLALTVVCVSFNLTPPLLHFSKLSFHRPYRPSISWC